MFDDHGDAQLADFGLAKLATSKAPFSNHYLGGTDAYMAPEPLWGKASPGSDLYSLGCVLFEMLTARLTFPSGHAAAEIASAPSPRDFNPRIPPALNRLCLQLLQPEAARRPASARQVLEQLPGAAGGTSPAGSCERLAG